MLKNFNKTLSKPQTQVQPSASQQKQTVVTGGGKAATNVKSTSKHEQMELLAFLDKCTQIMKDDRLQLRNLIKDGQGQEVEEIILKHKKKQDTQNLALDIRKYLNKSKFKGGSTPTSASLISNNAPTPQQKNSQANLQLPQQQQQQFQQQVDARQTRKGEQEQLYKQQLQQQQKTFTETLQMQQNKLHSDENQQLAFEQQQRQQQQLAMQMRQQQQLIQQQQLEQQIQQQNQYPQKMSPFRRPQIQQMQEMNNSNSPLKQSESKNAYQEDVKVGGAFGNFLEQQKSYTSSQGTKTEQKVTEYAEEDDQQLYQLQQQSLQNPIVEVNDCQENSLQNRLHDENEDDHLDGDQQQGYDEDEEEEQEQCQRNEDDYYRNQNEYQGDEGEYQSQSQYSHSQMSEQQQQQQYQSGQHVMISNSAVVTQNSQDLTPEQQNQYLLNLENQGQQNYFQQQFSSQIRRSNQGNDEGEGEEEEEQYSSQQVEEAIIQEQQRIQQQDAEMTRIMREREQIIQSAIERSEQSRYHNSTTINNTCQNEEEEEQQQQQRATIRDEEDSQVQEEFFDHINDLDKKDTNMGKLNLIKFGSLQRGNSYQVADDPITPMNHPVHMDSEVKRAPIKHRIEEINEQLEEENPFNFKKHCNDSASNTKSKYSEVDYVDTNGDQRYRVGLSQSKRGEGSHQKKYTQDSESKFNNSAFSAREHNSVRKVTDVEMTTECIQHNFEAQMEKAYYDQQRIQKSVQKSQNDNVFLPQDKYSQSNEKQQFNHMNLFNCAVSGFAQDSVQQPFSGRDLNKQYDSKANYNLDNYVKSVTNQFTQPEENDDSCSINFANEKVELKYNVEEMLDCSARESNLQNAQQLTYIPKSEILKTFSQGQTSNIEASYNMPQINVNNSTTLNVVQKTYDHYYPERVAIDMTNNTNLFQKKTTPTIPANIFNTPSQQKYLSIGLSQETNSYQKVNSSSILPTSILRSPAFRREYLRGTADPSANRDRVTSVLSPSRDHQRMDPSQDPIKRKYNYLFTSPQLMKQCNVEFDRDNLGISDSPQSHQKFIKSERELVEQETKEYLKRSVERSVQKVYQSGNSNLFTNWDQMDVASSRVRDSSIPKKSINFIRSPYSNNTLKESVMTTPNMKQSIQLPQFLTSANQYTNTEKSIFVAKFSLYNKTAQEIFDIIFGCQIFQDKVTKLAFRNRIGSIFTNVPTSDIDNFFDFLDINQDSVLDVNEVGPVLMSMCNYKSKENCNLIRVFNFFDTDRKGFITRLETEHLIHPSILKKNYHNSALNISKQLFKEVDLEGKGYITYWELYSCKNQEPVKQLIDILTN